MTKTKSTYLALLAVLLTPMAANADLISATDSGAYNTSGDHFSDNTNYIASNINRNWFVFDLSGIGTISAATFHLNTAEVFSDGTYTLWDVLTDVGTLTAGGSGLIGIHDDLGMGEMFGSISILASMDYQIIEIELSAAAISSINAASGLWAIGGNFDASYAFGFSSESLTRELDVTAVPEPTTLALLGIGLFGMGLARRRKAV